MRKRFFAYAHRGCQIIWLSLPSRAFRVHVTIQKKAICGGASPIIFNAESHIEALSGVYLQLSDNENCMFLYSANITRDSFA